MCGIMGFVKTGEPTVKTGSVIRKTFAGIEVRGRDASGYGVFRNGKVSAYKRPVLSSKLANSKKFASAIGVGQIVIGHSRAATSGTPEVNRNNHPFWTEDGRYVMVHNGIIMENPERLALRSDCDSEIALRMIEKHGVIEAFERMAEWRSSSFAILVIDTKDGSLYLCRDSGRPAAFVNLRTEIGGYLIGSTRKILNGVLNSCRIIKAQNRIIDTRPWSVYRFQPGVSDITPVRLSCYESKIAEEAEQRFAYRTGQFGWAGKNQYVGPGYPGNAIRRVG
jgi:glutamine phosphoribosylpyrophosphate amidotransferase